MRDFFRMAIRMVMVLFLVAGCVNNIYYLGELTKNSHNSYHNYNGYGYNNRNNYVDVEEVEEVQGNPEDTAPTQEEEYPDYNRPMTPY